MPIVGTAAHGPAVAPRAVAIWLFCSAAMVFAMAVIGAITRLTESGLSMVEWRPLIGALPPLSEAEWQRVFQLYQATPEYQHKHYWMGIDDFKTIFFWEWLHRLWGRLIGVVYLVPLAWFWASGTLPTDLRPRLLGLLALGALQGLMGWYMVMSGLVDRPSVSHYRLALHLGLAFILFALLISTALAVLHPKPVRTAGRRSLVPAPTQSRLLGWLLAAAGLLGLTIVWGAFVAGMDAGLIYNTWPLMGNRWLASEIGAVTPLWLDAVENHATVQFVHRWLAVLAGAGLLAAAAAVWRATTDACSRRLALALGTMTLVQIALGIATLLYSVPIVLAALHQAGAFALVGLLVGLHHRQSRLAP